jgi:hypothetical protein
VTQFGPSFIQRQLALLKQKAPRSGLFRIRFSYFAGLSCLPYCRRQAAIPHLIPTLVDIAVPVPEVPLSLELDI